MAPPSSLLESYNYSACSFYFLSHWSGHEHHYQRQLAEATQICLFPSGFFLHRCYLIYIHATLPTFCHHSVKYSDLSTK